MSVYFNRKEDPKDHVTLLFAVLNGIAIEAGAREVDQDLLLFCNLAEMIRDRYQSIDVHGMSIVLVPSYGDIWGVRPSILGTVCDFGNCSQWAMLTMVFVRTHVRLRWPPFLPPVHALSVTYWG